MCPTEFPGLKFKYHTQNEQSLSLGEMRKAICLIKLSAPAALRVGLS